jgi:hypothetical protein
MPRIPAHGHVRVVGEGPGGTGPIGPFQRPFTQVDVGLARMNQGKP